MLSRPWSHPSWYPDLKITNIWFSYESLSNHLSTTKKFQQITLVLTKAVLNCSVCKCIYTIQGRVADRQILIVFNVSKK